jgi:hypothetical protein
MDNVAGMKIGTKLICVGTALLAAAGAFRAKQTATVFFAESGGGNTPAVFAPARTTGGFTSAPSTGGLQVRPLLPSLRALSFQLSTLERTSLAAAIMRRTDGRHFFIRSQGQVQSLETSQHH